MYVLTGEYCRIYNYPHLSFAKYTSDMRVVEEMRVPYESRDQRTVLFAQQASEREHQYKYGHSMAPPINACRAAVCGLNASRFFVQLAQYYIFTNIFIR